ncbi:methyl-accepting chemotaxis protein, partial [Campylobacter cuniculorum]
MFKFFSNLSIGTKITSLVLVVLALSLVVLVTISTSVFKKSYLQQTEILLAETSLRNISQVKAAYDEVSTLAESIKQNINLNDSYDDINSLIRENMDITKYSEYMFLLSDKPFINEPSTARTPSGKHLILVHDNDTLNKGGLTNLPATDMFNDFNVIVETKKNKKDTIGYPRIIKIGDKEVFALFVGFPILDANQNVEAILGVLVDIKLMSASMTSKASVFGEGVTESVFSADGTFLLHSTPSLITKNVKDLGAEIDNSIKALIAQNKQTAFDFDYVASNGQKSILALTRLEIAPGNIWYSVMGIPVSFIDDILNRIYYISFALSVGLFIVLTLLILFISKKFIGARLNNLLKFLGQAFDFINHKTKTIELLPVQYNDELGQMATAINENIRQTKLGFEQDNSAVKESVETVSIVESGNLTARITANPRNPQLVELKNVLNRLLDALQSRVGSDMNIIHDIFEEYKHLDFRNKIENATGNVEVTTNALGEEIIKML